MAGWSHNIKALGFKPTRMEEKVEKCFAVTVALAMFSVFF
jgi:hypothetical protein